MTVVFVPNDAKTRGGVHNKAKRRCKRKMADGHAQVSHRQQRRHNKKLRKYLAVMECGSQSVDKDFKGKFCEDPAGFDADRVPPEDRFSLEDMVHVAPGSWAKTEKGLQLVGKDKSGKPVALAIRIPKRQAQRMKELHHKFQKALDKILKVKDNVKRGADNHGKCKHYKLFGWRKEPKGKDVGEYVFKKNTNPEVKSRISRLVATYVGQLEALSSHYLSPEDRAGFSNMKKAMDLPSVSSLDDGIFTQFALSQEYWSPQHKDNDFFWTMLSVLDKNFKKRGGCKKKKKEKTLYWFVFPEFKACVPLCHGDILLFNPLVMHGCTNHAQEKAFIFSAYVSSKTVASRASNVEESA